MISEPTSRWLLELVFDDGGDGLGVSVSDYTGGTDNQFILNMAAHLDEMFSHRSHDIQIHHQGRMTLRMEGVGDAVIANLGWNCIVGDCVVYDGAGERENPHDEEQ